MPRLAIAALLLILCVLAALAAPAAASAPRLEFRPPADPPPEDVPFTIELEGAVDGSPAGVRVVGEARAASGLPCATTPEGDPGLRFIDEAFSLGFAHRGEFVPRGPVEHLLCAWLVNATGEVAFGPVSTVVPVRPARLHVGFDVLRPAVRPGSVADVLVDFSVEAPRRLFVFFARGTSCDVDTGPIDFPSPAVYQQLGDVDVGSGTGSFVAAVDAVRWGQYILCASLSDRDTGVTPPSGLTGSKLVRVGGPRRRCSAVFGRRGITRVHVGGISCDRGRSVARRWGRAASPPRTVSGLRCRRRSGRTVRCSAAAGEVTFRYRRRAPAATRPTASTAPSERAGLRAATTRRVTASFHAAAGPRSVECSGGRSQRDQVSTRGRPTSRRRAPMRREPSRAANGPQRGRCLGRRPSVEVSPR